MSAPYFPGALFLLSAWYTKKVSCYLEREKGAVTNYTQELAVSEWGGEIASVYHETDSSFPSFEPQS